ncbi:gfo/Idh/MocA family oxidoreductase, partial [Enterococcus faecium]|nr:gfo/Idh/MocA family oxidoreductase [Enterococcus faecium]
GQRYEEWVELARSVNETVSLMRKQSDIIFDADKK